MSLQQLLIIFLARKWLVVSYLSVTMLATLIFSLVMPKQYSAGISLVLDQPSINPITGANLPIQLTAAYMSTQTDIIKSPYVALTVIKILDLIHDEDYQESFRKEAKLKLEQYELLQTALREGKGKFKGTAEVKAVKQEIMADFRNWLAETLIKGLDVVPPRESNILGIGFSATDPEVAAKTANAYGQAYIQTTNELKRQSIQQTADWFEEQSRIHKDRMEKAQEELSSFQQEHGIIATFSEERVDLEDAKLTELSTQLVRNQLETADLVAKKNQLTKTLDNIESLKSLDDVLNNVVLQELKSQLAFKEATFADLKKTFAHNHPRYLRAAAEIADLKKQIMSEIKTVLHGFNNKILSAKQRDKQLAKAVKEQKKRVLELKQYYDEIVVRKRELENAKVMYDEVTRRAIQMRMESEIRQSNAAILDHAVVPSSADKPKVKLNMVLSVFLGSILGLGAALFAEIMDRRIRSPADIIDGLDLPVFGVLTNPNPPKKFRWSFFGAES